MLSGSGGIITFWPLSLSRGTSPVRMAPGSPFSPCNSKNLSMKWASPRHPIHKLAAISLAFKPPLQPPCPDMTSCWNIAQPPKGLNIVYSVASMYSSYCLKAQVGVLQAPPRLLLLLAQHPHLNSPGTSILKVHPTSGCMLPTENLWLLTLIYLVACVLA